MPLDLLELMYDALRTPLGIIVRTEDADRLRQRLYPLRKDRPDLARLIFVISPTAPATELWIIARPSNEQE